MCYELYQHQEGILRIHTPNVHTPRTPMASYVTLVYIPHCPDLLVLSIKCILRINLPFLTSSLPLIYIAIEVPACPGCGSMGSIMMSIQTLEWKIIISMGSIKRVISCSSLLTSGDTARGNLFVFYAHSDTCLHGRSLTPSMLRRSIWVVYPSPKPKRST